MTKRIVAALLLAIVALAPLAPAASAEFRYGPVAGVNLNSLKFKSKIFPVHQSVGAEAGVMGELMFPGIGFGIDFGLLYNMMGARTDLGSRKVWAYDIHNQPTGIGNPTVMIHTIQIPVHLRFKWTRMMGLEDYIAPFVYGGPDFAFVVGHNSIRTSPYSYSAGDFSLTCGGGLEVFKRFQVSVQYTWGMTNIIRTRKLDDLTADNRQWSFRLAYFF